MGIATQAPGTNPDASGRDVSFLADNNALKIIRDTIELALLYARDREIQINMGSFDLHGDDNGHISLLADQNFKLELPHRASEDSPIINIYTYGLRGKLLVHSFSPSSDHNTEMIEATMPSLDYFQQTGLLTAMDAYQFTSLREALSLIKSIEFDYEYLQQGAYQFIVDLTKSEARVRIHALLEDIPSIIECLKDAKTKKPIIIPQEIMNTLSNDESYAMAFSHILNFLFNILHPVMIDVQRRLIGVIDDTDGLEKKRDEAVLLHRSRGERESIFAWKPLRDIPYIQHAERDAETLAILKKAGLLPAETPEQG